MYIIQVSSVKLSSIRVRLVQTYTPYLPFRSRGKYESVGVNIIDILLLCQDNHYSGNYADGLPISKDLGEVRDTALLRTPRPCLLRGRACCSQHLKRGIDSSAKVPIRQNECACGTFNIKMGIKVICYVLLSSATTALNIPPGPVQSTGERTFRSIVLTSCIVYLSAHTQSLTRHVLRCQYPFQLSPLSKSFHFLINHTY